MIFTCDVEEWYHAENIKQYVQIDKKKHSSLSYLDNILEFLEQKSAFGTFFVLGSVAQSNPNLVKKIHSSGHEIASHGMSHELLGTMDLYQTRRELCESKEILEQLISEEVVGFRSPCFSSNVYLENVLVDAGYRYTSNGIRASFHSRYSRQLEKQALLHDFELPVCRIGRLSIPATGGGWFRLFPSLFQRILVSFVETEPVVFYCHPWDFDPKQPIQKVPNLQRFRHSVNSSKSMRKLEGFDWERTRLKDLLIEK